MRINPRGWRVCIAACALRAASLVVGPGLVELDTVEHLPFAGYATVHIQYLTSKNVFNHISINPYRLIISFRLTMIHACSCARRPPHTRRKLCARNVCEAHERARECGVRASIMRTNQTISSIIEPCNAHNV